MSYKAGDLVTYNQFEAGRRGSNTVMLVVEKFTRIKREGAYYRVIDQCQLTICHSSQIEKVRENERED